MSMLWVVGVSLTPRPGWLHLLALWAPALGPFWMLGMAFTSDSDTEQGFAIILFFGPALGGFLVCLFGSLFLLAKFPTKQD